MKPSTGRRLRFFTALLLLLFTPLASYGAQDGEIIADKAEIRVLPDPTAPVLETHVKGERLRISNATRDGYYKVLTSAHQFGWISQTQVNPWTLSRELQENQLETRDRAHPSQEHEHEGKKEPFVFIRAVGSGLWIFGSDALGPLGGNPLTYLQGYGGFAEVGFAIQDRFRFLLRGGYFTSQSTADISSGGNTYSIAQDDLPMMVGLAYDLVKSPSWALGLALYGGISLQNDMTVTTTTLAGGVPVYPGLNAFTVTSYCSPIAMLNFYAKWRVSHGFGFVMELGAYYDQSTAQQIGSDFQGSNPQFGGPSPLTSLRIRNISPVASLGVEFTF